MAYFRLYLCLLRKEEKQTKEKGIQAKKKEIGKTAIGEETAILFDFTSNRKDVFTYSFPSENHVLGWKS